MLDESMFEDIHEIAENSAYLKAIEEKDVSLEMLEQLPPYAQCQHIEQKLQQEGRLNFDSIFNEATGFYCLKCFLIADYAVDKAIFIKDVQAYRSMRFESARKKIAQLLYQRFVSTDEATQQEFRPGTSVFQLMNQQNSNPTQSTTSNNTFAPNAIDGSMPNFNKTNGNTNSQQRGSAIGNNQLAPDKSVVSVNSIHPSQSNIVSNNQQSAATLNHIHFSNPLNSNLISNTQGGVYNIRLAGESMFQMFNNNNSIGVYGKSVRIVAEKVARGEAPRNLFDDIARDVMNDLKLDVFPRFKQSEFYKKYIRTKWMESQKILVRDFTTFRVLGRGGFGAVHACRKKNSGQIYAMKQINKKLVKVKSALDNVLEERNVLTMMTSPFVTNLKYALQDEETLYLIMDLMLGGDLKFHLINAGRFTEKRARFYAAQVLLGLEHVHSHCVELMTKVATWDVERGIVIRSALSVAADFVAGQKLYMLDRHSRPVPVKNAMLNPFAEQLIEIRYRDGIESSLKVTSNHRLLVCHDSIPIFIREYHNVFQRNNASIELLYINRKFQYEKRLYHIDPESLSHDINDQKFCDQHISSSLSRRRFTASNNIPFSNLSSADCQPYNDDIKPHNRLFNTFQTLEEITIQIRRDIAELYKINAILSPRELVKIKAKQLLNSDPSIPLFFQRHTDWQKQTINHSPNSINQSISSSMQPISYYLDSNSATLLPIKFISLTPTFHRHVSIEVDDGDHVFLLADGVPTSNSIIYRDMKLENVLLDHAGHARLSDLGLAVVTKVKIKGYAGTPGYTAPEMIKNKLYGFQADIFSYGVMLYRMLCGSKPFKGKVDRDLDKAVIERKPQFPKEIFSKEAIQLLTGLLQKRPENRCGCSAEKGILEIKESPFFESIDWGLLEAGYLDPPFVPNKFDVNAASLKDIGDFDKAKYKHVKLDDRFKARIKNFEYVSIKALQDEMVMVLEKADENTNFEKFAQQPQQQQTIQQVQSGPCCVVL